jgi:hypothetical protein
VDARLNGNFVEITFTAPKSPAIFSSAILVVVGSEPLTIPISGFLIDKVNRTDGATPCDDCRFE